MVNFRPRSNLTTYGLVSTVLFGWTVLNAFRMRSNFYSSFVYLSRSNACMMIIWNQAIYQTVLFGKLLQKIFFGELRMLEVERLQERGWFAITETLLALTIFKDEFDTKFILLFGSLLFLKVFHWLASDRIELMEQSVNLSRVFHLRMSALLSLLWLVDIAFMVYSIESILMEGPTVMIMFASEYMILLAGVWSCTMKYAINTVDARSEQNWEDKSIYVFYVDLIADFFKLCTYLTFFFLILTFYGLPLNILRDVYITFRSFILKCRDLKRYRQATSNMNELYPDVGWTEWNEMRDRTCIICREDCEYRGVVPPSVPVVVEGEEDQEGAEGIPIPIPTPTTNSAPRTGPNDTPKKLPCGHVFHFHCLKSWLERQQSCPTCRRSVLPGANPPTPAPRAGDNPVNNPINQDQVQMHEEALRQAQINLARNLGREAFAVVFPGIPFPPEANRNARAEGDEQRRNATALARTTSQARALQQQHARQHNAALTAVGLAPVAAGGVATPPGLDLDGNTTTRSSASIRRERQTGVNGDNPLARFSLPDLKLPPTGEAGLYSPPGRASNATNGYAGVAYGVYQDLAPNSGKEFRAPGGSGSSQTKKVLNLEERLEKIRTKLRAKGTPEVRVTESSASGSISPLPSPGVPTAAPVVSGSETTGAASPSILSARRDALAAAERRANNFARTNGTPVTTSASPMPSPTATSPLSPSPPTISSPTIARTSSSTPPATTGPNHAALFNDFFQRGPSPAAASRPTSSAADSGSRPTPSPSPFLSRPPTAGDPAYPRLIPLFNPSSPLSTTLYPNLLSTMPPALTHSPLTGRDPRKLPSQNLLDDEMSEEQLREMSRLTRKGLEERLRVIVGFQKKFELLAGEMNRVLSVLPPDEVGGTVRGGDDVNLGAGEEDLKVETGTATGTIDKGKRPVEGIHAVVEDIEKVEDSSLQI